MRQCCFQHQQERLLPLSTCFCPCLQVKRIYMKANLIVHPDKVKQKGGTLEQITIADMVFDVLKVAWGKFEGTSS